MTDDAHCVLCGAHNPEMTRVGDWFMCRHRKACEARQMLQRGVPVEAAAAHAQGLSERVSGGQPQYQYRLPPTG